MRGPGYAPRRVRRFALSAVGRDRPGIVAAVAEALLAHDANIEDSNMGILHGHFALTLILAVPDRADLEGLAHDVDGAARRVGLPHVHLEAVDPAAPAQPEPTHIVSVYGIDHPGIVHAVSTALAGRGATITDLRTQVAGGEEEAPLYAMLLEVAVPGDPDPEELAGALAAVAAAERVEVSVRRLESDAL